MFFLRFFFYYTFRAEQTVPFNIAYFLKPLLFPKTIKRLLSIRILQILFQKSIISLTVFLCGIPAEKKRAAIFHNAFLRGHLADKAHIDGNTLFVMHGQAITHNQKCSEWHR